ncbi:hypothetical protein ACTXT7_003241 [Hymenolepis weldensis]
MPAYPARQNSNEHPHTDEVGKKGWGYFMTLMVSLVGGFVYANICVPLLSATEPSFTSYSSSFHTPFARHHLDHRQRSQGRLGQSGGGGSTLPFPPPLLISLPLDMFSDLPSQLAIASNSTQVAVTGDIVFFAESLTTSNLSAVEANNGNNASDLSSSLLLLLIVCVLFLLLGIFLVPARLGICFWQRFCSFSISRSAKSRRSHEVRQYVVKNREHEVKLHKATLLTEI